MLALPLSWIRSEQRGQANDQRAREARAHLSFEPETVAAVGVIVELCAVELLVCRMQDWVDVDGGDQHEALALDLIERLAEARQAALVCFWLFVGEPLLCRCPRTDHSLEALPLELADVLTVEEAVEALLRS
jgi:hypothetical protein